MAPAEERTGAVVTTADLDDPLLFDAQYYASLYPDLQAAFGNDQAALRDHWLTHGIAEHRRASPIFDCDLYLALYPDLADAFGDDCAAAMTHFREIGLPDEARRGSVEFDVTYYLATYPDLQAAFGATGYRAAASHFMTHGMWKEGRAGSNEFDVSYYICHYPDLASAFFGDPRDAVEHWTTLGLPGEGRRGATHFDIQSYLANNPDVQTAFGNDFAGAIQHWLVHGIPEGRSGDPGDGGGTSLLCASGTAVELHATTTTSSTGFPTTWFGVPISDTPLGYAGLNGTVSVNNSADIFSEVLFIVGYLPSGDCIAGQWPATTPEFGPPGFINVTNLIVKAPTAGTYTSPANFALPGNLPISHCLMVGLNGGTVAAPHDVTSSSHLTLRYTTTPGGSSITGVNNEFCFGQDGGCEAATSNNALSFASVVQITQPQRLVALFGNISDSTFDGSSNFGPLPTGAWTALNDFYVYHGAECDALGASGGIAGPADFYGQIPGDAIHLFSQPISGNGIGAAAVSGDPSLRTAAVASRGSRSTVRLVQLTAVPSGAGHRQPALPLPAGVAHVEGVSGTRAARCGRAVAVGRTRGYSRGHRRAHAHVVRRNASR